MPDTQHLLDNVLIISAHKSFWASPECEIFPHRIYTRRIFPGPGKWGTTRNPANNLTAAIDGYRYFLRHRPRLIYLASATRVVPWYTTLKRLGLLPGAKLIATAQSYLSDAQVRYLERLIVYSSAEIALHDPALQNRYTFIPLPADGNFNFTVPESPAPYIFAGGGAGRDFRSLIEAIRGLDIPLKIVTFSPRTLGYNEPLPSNCTVEWRMPLADFLNSMAAARFVVAPLQAGIHPHGHTTIVQALRLGKAVVSTSQASVEDYVRDRQEGLLVLPGDVDGYRRAILELWNNSNLRNACEEQARAKSADFTYSIFAERLIRLFAEVLKS